MHISGKTWGHDVGLSCCFRQWRANSHCSLLHGYAIAVSVEFEAKELDERNWVIDFGSLAVIKSYLQDTFDHKLVVAEDDPQLDFLCQLSGLGLASVVVLPAVGCEAFAQHIYGKIEGWLQDKGHSHRVRCKSVTVREHGANHASYMPAKPVQEITQNITCNVDAGAAIEEIQRQLGNINYKLGTNQE